MHCVNTCIKIHKLPKFYVHNYIVAHCTPVYKNLRIGKILDFMVLKDSIVAHMCIKIHRLPKFYVR
jgi:hypothetical protein